MAGVFGGVWVKELLRGGSFAIGFFTGIFACLSSYIIFSGGVALPSDPTLFGAIIGALLAGATALLAVIISAVVQRVSELRLEKLQRNERYFLILARVLDHNDLITKVYRHWLSGDETDQLALQSVVSGKDKGSFRLTKPIFGLENGVPFELSDEAFCLAEKKNELGQLLGNLRRARFSILSLHDEYYQHFETLVEMSIRNPRTQVNGTRVKSTEEFAEVELLRLRDLEQHIRDFVLRHYPETKSAIQKTFLILEEEFQRKLTFEELPDESPTINSSLRAIVEGHGIDLNAFKP